MRFLFLRVSRSETSGMFPPGRASGVVTVSQYNKEALVLEGSELCFEEVQAQKYFQKLQGRKETSTPRVWGVYE